MASKLEAVMANLSVTVVRLKILNPEVVPSSEMGAAPLIETVSTSVGSLRMKVTVVPLMVTPEAYGAAWSTAEDSARTAARPGRARLRRRIDGISAPVRSWFWNWQH